MGREGGTALVPAATITSSCKRRLPDIWKSMNFATHLAPRDLRKGFMLSSSVLSTTATCLIEQSCAGEWFWSFFFFLLWLHQYTFMSWSNTTQIPTVSKNNSCSYCMQCAPVLFYYVSWKRKCWFVPLPLFDNKLVSHGLKLGEPWAARWRSARWQQAGLGWVGETGSWFQPHWEWIPQWWQMLTSHGLCRRHGDMWGLLCSRNVCRLDS